MVVLHLMYVRIFNDGWAELEEIKQEKKTMFFKKKIRAFHLLSVTSSQSNPTMIMKPEVLVSGALCTTLSTAAG